MIRRAPTAMRRNMSAESLRSTRKERIAGRMAELAEIRQQRMETALLRRTAPAEFGSRRLSPRTLWRQRWQVYVVTAISVQRIREVHDAARHLLVYKRVVGFMKILVFGRRYIRRKQAIRNAKRFWTKCAVYVVVQRFVGRWRYRDRAADILRLIIAKFVSMDFQFANSRVRIFRAAKKIQRAWRSFLGHMVGTVLQWCDTFIVLEEEYLKNLFLGLSMDMIEVRMDKGETNSGYDRRSYYMAKERLEISQKRAQRMMERPTSDPPSLARRPSRAPGVELALGSSGGRRQSKATSPDRRASKSPERAGTLPVRIPKPSPVKKKGLGADGGEMKIVIQRAKEYSIKLHVRWDTVARLYTTFLRSRARLLRNWAIVTNRIEKDVSAHREFAQIFGDGVLDATATPDMEAKLEMKAEHAGSTQVDHDELNNVVHALHLAYGVSPKRSTGLYKKEFTTKTENMATAIQHYMRTRSMFIGGRRPSTFLTMPEDPLIAKLKDLPPPCGVEVEFADATRTSEGLFHEDGTLPEDSDSDAASYSTVERPTSFSPEKRPSFEQDE